VNVAETNEDYSPRSFFRLIAVTAVRACIKASDDLAISLHPDTLCPSSPVLFYPLTHLAQSPLRPPNPSLTRPSSKMKTSTLIPVVAYLGLAGYTAAAPVAVDAGHALDKRTFCIFGFGWGCNTAPAPVKPTPAAPSTSTKAVVASSSAVKSSAVAAPRLSLLPPLPPAPKPLSLPRPPSPRPRLPTGLPAPTLTGTHGDPTGPGAVVSTKTTSRVS
jgi:hypothetical protein